MKTLRFCASKERAFALMVALGVLAALTFIIMAAADSTQITWLFSHARASDQKLGDAIEQVVRAVPPAELVPASVDSISTAPLKTVELCKGEPGAIMIFVWPGDLASMELAQAVVSPKPGDALVRLEAATVKQQTVRRSGIYLVNTAGQRPVPILLEEKRYVSQSK